MISTAFAIGRSFVALFANPLRAAAVVLIALLAALPHTLLHAVMRWMPMLLQMDAGTPSPAPDASFDPQGTALTLYQAFQAKDWNYAIAAVVVLLVWLVRKYGAFIPKVGPYLNQHPTVGYALPFVISCGTAVLSALAAHQSVMQALLAGVQAAATAVAAYVGIRKVGEAKSFSLADATAKVATVADAGRVLDKGP